MANELLSEKVSVNINTSTLSSIDLLVENGYYSNRSDFINQAVRGALQQQQSTIDRILSQSAEAARREEKNWFVGIYGITASEVEAMYRRGESMSLTGHGLLSIDEEVDPEKLFAVLTSVSVKGRIICTDPVKEHYGLKNAVRSRKNARGE